MGRGQTTSLLDRTSRLEPWTPGSDDRSCTPADAALYLAMAYSRLCGAPLDDAAASCRTAGLERFEDYVLGFCEGIPKTPEWAARVTGVPSYTIKALAANGDAQMQVVDTEEHMAEVISKAASLRAESFVSPRSRYQGLPRTLVGGTVYDYEADEVIEGARVTIRHMPAEGVHGTAAEGRGEVTVTTDALGTFLVEGAEPGTYSVSVEKDGYASKAWDPIEMGNDTNLRDFPMFLDSEDIIWW